MSKSQTLKEINEQKRALTEQQRQIREELAASKEDRKAARKLQAELRVVIKSQKAELRSLVQSCSAAMSTGSSEEISHHASDLNAAASALAVSLDKFADSYEGL